MIRYLVPAGAGTASPCCFRSRVDDLRESSLLRDLLADTIGYRVSKFLQRHPVPVVATAVVIVALSAGLFCATTLPALRIR